jgi:F420H(2)-dependent quinone reductase
MKVHDDYLRWLYRGRRPHWFARLQNRASALAFGAGIWPTRVAALDVTGRRSSRVVTFPVVITDLDGDRYLVSMLGERANWVGNVRADEGRAVLRHGRREAVKLEEVPVPERAPVLRRYLEVAPGGRPHIPVDRGAPLDAFERVAEQYPVFRIEPAIPRRADPSP